MWIVYLFLFLQSLFSKVREQFISLYYVSFLVLRYFAVIWFYFLVHGAKLKILAVNVSLLVLATLFINVSFANQWCAATLERNLSSKL